MSELTVCGAATELVRWDRSFVAFCNRLLDHDGPHEQWLGDYSVTWESQPQEPPQEGKG